MFKNLKAEITRVGMTNAKFAAVINMKSRLFSQKISGKSEFKRSEMLIIKNELKKQGNNCSVNYLFELENEEA